MKTDMLRAEKAIARGRTRALDNFKKKWIPFILKFAQTDLKKANEGELFQYRKGLIFLDSGFNERFDEDGFQSSWKRGDYENLELDLKKIQKGFEWVSKYLGRKDKTDAIGYPLTHVKTILMLSIDKEDDRLITRPILLMEEKNPSLQLMYRIRFFFMQIFNDFPLSSIRVCEGCKRFFVHFSKRQREYCSPSCSSRSIQREKREDLKKHHPRKHKQFLIEQRFRMGELRLGPKKYSAYLKKNDKKHLKDYERWRKRFTL